MPENSCGCFCGKNKFADFLIKMAATGFFISYLPPKIFKFKKNTGAGLAGTIVGLMFVPMLPEGNAVYLLFLLGFSLFAVWISQKASVLIGGETHDDPRIVIDEIIGYWFAIAFLPKTLELLIICFVLFRLFDTVKPFFIKKLDSFKGGLGIVLDDVAAGIAANVLVHLGIKIIRWL